jgi:hypothetical protein
MAYAILIFLMVLHVVGMIGTTVMVGKERKPITPGTAAVSTVINMTCLAGLVYIFIIL